MKPTPTLLVVFALLGPAAADDARSDRARALEALKSKLPAAERYLRHSLAVEAISRELAAPGDDVDHWGLAGLLHDIDIGRDGGRSLAARRSRCGDRPRRLPDEVVHAVLAQDGRPRVARTSRP